MEIQDQQDNVADEAAIIALTRAASNTAVLRSQDGITNFVLV